MQYHFASAADVFDTLERPMSHYELVGLVKAYSKQPWRNTQMDECRRQAAIWALKHRYAYARECRLRRDGLSSRNLWTASQLLAFQAREI